jgi:hypothetical protein
MALVLLLLNVNVNNYGQECFNHGLMLDFQLKAILIQIPLHAWTNFFIRVQSSTFFVTNKGHMTRSNVYIAATESNSKKM